MKPISDPEIDKQLADLRPESMLPAMTRLVERAREVDPKLSQSDIINGLALDYCRIEAKDGATRSLGQAQSRSRSFFQTPTPP